MLEALPASGSLARGRTGVKWRPLVDRPDRLEAEPLGLGGPYQSAGGLALERRRSLERRHARRFGSGRRARR